jgi:hypothetical protein
VRYPSDLTDEHWDLERDLFETRRGARARIPRQRMVDAILCAVDSNRDCAKHAFVSSW